MLGQGLKARRTSWHVGGSVKRSAAWWQLAARGVALVVGLSLASAHAQTGADAVAGPDVKGPGPSVAELCRVLAQAASDNDLPEAFFTRLIWQESRFDPEAVSEAGAQGIAQFMPQTAAGRGLINPFDPVQGLHESASYLRELRATFSGNLGLAAAAYNAGPSRVEAWMAGRGLLPGETRAYVHIVTGHTADAWASRTPPTFQESETTRKMGCIELAASLKESQRRRVALTSSPAWGPWGVQLAGNWSEGRVLATYERLRRRHAAVLGDRLPLVLIARRRVPSRFIVRVSENSQAAADSLCARLRAAGGACMVLRNPRY
ncbi:lytic transglycosylase domain-containing protein [Reyranella sp. CPCC 100927]|nr:lytic transglycosylase domain-containing protein [Reyranella sp. CPCC 100927]